MVYQQAQGEEPSQEGGKYKAVTDIGTRFDSSGKRGNSIVSVGPSRSLIFVSPLTGLPVKKLPLRRRIHQSRVDFANSLRALFRLIDKLWKVRSVPIRITAHGNVDRLAKNLISGRKTLSTPLPGSTSLCSVHRFPAQRHLRLRHVIR
jgi:hypothetical protein